jgi:hypothetical protein
MTKRWVKFKTNNAVKVSADRRTLIDPFSGSSSSVSRFYYHLRVSYDFGK